MRIDTDTVAAFAVAVCLAASTTATAQVTKDEFKCQQGTSKAVARFVGSKLKCVTKCEQNARKGKNPVADCAPPYAGTTLTCIRGTTKAAEDKAKASMAKACAKDCPECYAGGDCAADATARIADAESQIDALVPSVYCDDPDPLTKQEVACEDTVAKTAAKFEASTSKCYDSCNKALFDGDIPTGSCTPPAPTDTKTQDCITKAESKSVAAIDKKCGPPKGDVPECFSSSATGSFVSGVAEAAVDAGVQATYCASPSGAFVD